MRKTTFWAAIVVGVLMQVGIQGWPNSGKRALESEASTPVEAFQLEVHQMMLNAKNLPCQEFEDFSLVFPSPPDTQCEHWQSQKAVLNGRGAEPARRRREDDQ
jgi:hypothetical protein